MAGILTGESVPVRKAVRSRPGGEGEGGRPGGEDTPLVFFGSTATGAASQIGRIGKSLGELETEPPRLQTQMNSLVRTFAFVGGGVTVVAVLLYGLLRGHWLEALPLGCR